MEGDAGSGQLNPSPPTSTDDEAERSEAEESVDTAMSAPADEVWLEAQQSEAPSGASRLCSRGWLVGICVLLLLLTAGSATAGALALRSHQKAAAAAREDVKALAAAKDCVTATQAPDATAMSESQRKIIECSTGDFGAQAALYSGMLVDAYQAANVQVQVSDMRAAVERHNGDGSIDVLVAVRVKVSNSQAADQEQGYRLRVRMAPDGGVYKIAKLDQVGK
jgi:Mce-associated membrane protein